MYEVIYISILLHGIIQEHIFNERNKKINLLIPLRHPFLETSPHINDARQKSIGRQSKGTVIHHFIRIKVTTQ